MWGSGDGALRCVGGVRVLCAKVVWCALPWWTDCAVPALTTYLVEGRWEATSGAHAASGGGTRRKAQAA